LIVWMAWLWPGLLGLSRVVQPDTILRWHRAGFRVYWHWKSRGRAGPQGRGEVALLVLPRTRFRADHNDWARYQHRPIPDQG
jgi:hypothetical protein